VTTALQFSSARPTEEKSRPRETLFTIDGRECTIPVKFEPLEMARYAHTVATFGADQAAVWALEMALGEDDYIAFLNLPKESVTTEDWARVVGVVTGRLVGLDVLVPKEAAGPVPVAVPESPSGDNPEPPDSEVWPNEEPSEDLTRPTPAT
jgi:hypothetical protein